MFSSKQLFILTAWNTLQHNISITTKPYTIYIQIIDIIYIPIIVFNAAHDA